MHAIRCNSATSKKNDSALQNKTTNYSIWIAKVQIKVEFITTFGETIFNRRVNRQKSKKFTAKSLRNLVADKGYISQSLFEEIFVGYIHLISRIRKCMKNSLMHLHDKILQRKDR